MRTLNLLVLISLSLLVGGCSIFSNRPTLRLDNAQPLNEALRLKVNNKLSSRNKEIGSVRALLKVRAQKHGFAQELSAAYIYSAPKQTRLSLFATQFNRLFALVVARPASLQVFLPDERTVLYGAPSAKAMTNTIGVPFSIDEFCAWLLGSLPEPIRERKIFWDADNNRVLTEQVLEGGQVMRGSLIKLKEGELRVVAIELLEDGKPVFYSSIYWPKQGEYPIAHVVDFPNEGVNLRLEFSKLEVNSQELEAENAKKVFSLPDVYDVRRIPIISLDREDALLFPR